MITAGIDIGNKNLKVLVLADGEVLARRASTAGFGRAGTLGELYAEALEEAGLQRSMVAHVSATGAGRRTVEFADSVVTEVGAAALAGSVLFPGARCVIDVGAEESRAVHTDGAGRVLDSSVNEKCAADSGSFTESMARALGMEYGEFAHASTLSTEHISMNAQCTVFAESEVVSLIHQSTAKKDIARAVHDAIANRVAAMARRAGCEGEPVLIGGLALNEGFVKSIKDALRVAELHLAAHPEYGGALGAAAFAARKAAAKAARGGGGR